MKKGYLVTVPEGTKIAETSNALLFDAPKQDRELYRVKSSALEDARTTGQKEAWELAQKIVRRPESDGYTVDDLRQAFDITDVVPDRDVPDVCIIQESFSSASTSLKKVEFRKNKPLTVGDLVRVHSGNVHYDGRLALVVGLRELSCGNCYKVVFDDGDVSVYSSDVVDYVKTVGFTELFLKEKE